jgi:hypothetical protein
MFASAGGQLSMLGAGVLASLMAGFVLDSAEGYISWQARWLKDSSVVANLAATPGADKYSVYWIKDDYRLGGEPAYRFYEWSALIGLTYGGQSRVGIDADPPDPSFLQSNAPFFNSSYNVVGFDPAGCEAVVSISPGPTAGTELGMVAHYFLYGVFDPAYRDRWVAGLTKVSVMPYPSSNATNCS